MVITFTKASGEQMAVIINEKTADKLIDVLYPDIERWARGVSKGYIELVNFIHDGRTAQIDWSSEVLKTTCPVCGIELDANSDEYFAHLVEEKRKMFRQATGQ